MKSPLRTILVAGVIVLGLASVLVHPSGAVKGSTSTNLLLAGAVVDSETVKIMERSCQNCHSEKTDWPWYRYVAPVSWLVESDVHKARGHMNLSGPVQPSGETRPSRRAGRRRPQPADAASPIYTHASQPKAFPAGTGTDLSMSTRRAPSAEVIGCRSSHFSRWSSESVKNRNRSLEGSCCQRP